MCQQWFQDKYLSFAIIFDLTEKERLKLHNRENFYRFVNLLNKWYSITRKAIISESIFFFLLKKFSFHFYYGNLRLIEDNQCI